MRKHMMVTTMIFCLTFLPFQAWAATVYVDKSFGPGGDGSAAAPYDTIQEAIDDFNSDEIIVYPGTYTENILITKPITIGSVTD